MNKTLREFANSELKKGLSKCTEAQQLLFKRIYSPNNLELCISDCVNAIPDDKVDWAMQQVERTVSKQ